MTGLPSSIRRSVFSSPLETMPESGSISLELKKRSASGNSSENKPIDRSSKKTLTAKPLWKSFKISSNKRAGGTWRNRYADSRHRISQAGPTKRSNFDLNRAIRSIRTGSSSMRRAGPPMNCSTCFLTSENPST